MDLAITFLNGAQKGQTLEFRAPRRLVVGRAESADLPILDKKVSRRHCELVLQLDAVHVEDLGSGNGTYVNGERITVEKLETGDHLKIADTEIAVETISGGTLRLDGNTPLPAPPRSYLGPLPSVPGYKLLACLGEGTAGAVFKALAPDGELVAVKVGRIRREMLDEERRRFLREAEVARSLVHPNVVRILDRGESKDGLFIVMELVIGETLSARLKRTGPFPVLYSLHIFEQIAKALEQARVQGLVHRDVKPENMIVREDGVVKLADFGLAKSVLTAGASDLTRPGDTVGTLAYMAPEQIESSLSVGHAADIYAWGASLFQVLTGRVPFAAPTMVDYFKKIRDEKPPSVHELRPDVPLVVSAIVQRCLMKKPDDRYRSAGEMARILQTLVGLGAQEETMA